MTKTLSTLTDYLRDSQINQDDSNIMVNTSQPPVKDSQTQNNSVSTTHSQTAPTTHMQAVIDYWMEVAK